MAARFQEQGNGVKNPGNNNNMFAEAKQNALAPYADAVEGPVDAATCIVFADGLSDEARAALRAACKAIGFPDPSFLDAGVLGWCGVVGCDNATDPAHVATPSVVSGRDADNAVAVYEDGADAHPVAHGAAHASDSTRDIAKNLFAVIEALDPLMLVVADVAAAELLSAAHREPLRVGSHGFVFGRPYTAFSSFQRDLADPRMKQRDWALLKAMRKSAHWLG